MTIEPQAHRVQEPYPHAWGEQPWPLAIELSRNLPAESWSLVGGLMVKARAAISGFEHPRNTTDVDVLYLRANGSGFSSVAANLVRNGFTLSENTKLAYRFIRHLDQHDRDIVDVMVMQGDEDQPPNTFMGRKLMVVPGGVRASSEIEFLTLARGNTNLGTISVPSTRAAIILKGAAYTVDSRDALRHLEDGVMLLACIDSLDSIRDGLSLRSRKRVRALLRGVADHPEAWVNHNSIVRGIAKQRLEQLSRIFDLHGTGTGRSDDLGIPAPSPRTAVARSRRKDAGLGGTKAGGTSGSFAPNTRSEGTWLH